MNIRTDACQWAQVFLAEEPQSKSCILYSIPRPTLDEHHELTTMGGDGAHGFLAGAKRSSASFSPVASRRRSMCSAHAIDMTPAHPPPSPRSREIPNANGLRLRGQTDQNVLPLLHGTLEGRVSSQPTRRLDVRQGLRGVARRGARGGEDK